MNQQIILADAIGIAKDILTIIGAAFSITLPIIGFYLTIKYRRAKADRETRRLAREQREQEFKDYVDDVKHEIETKVEHLEQLSSSKDSAAEKQFTEFKREAVKKLATLTEDVNRINSNCARHQLVAQQDAVAEIKRSVRRINERIDSIKDSYVTIASYQHDLQLWTDNFNALRQNFRDHTALLTRFLNGGRGRKNEW